MDRHEQDADLPLKPDMGTLEIPSISIAWPCSAEK
jgi:hypothetical protein